MIEVECPRGPRLWVSTDRGTQAGALAAKAARLLGYSDSFVFGLADRRNRILRGDESVIDGDSYILVVEPLSRRESVARWPELEAKSAMG